MGTAFNFQTKLITILLVDWYSIRCMSNLNLHKEEMHRFSSPHEDVQWCGWIDQMLAPGLIAIWSPYTNK
jgi:hypothetical protein